MARPEVTGRNPAPGAQSASRIRTPKSVKSAAAIEKKLVDKEQSLIAGESWDALAKKPQAKTRSPRPADAAAYTISEFCEAHRISEAFYYKLRKKGLGPREARAMSKVTITTESAADWRRQRETTAAN